MDSSNHWYGHAHILAEYCGLDVVNPPPVQGIIQHGWTFVHGFGHGHLPPAGFTRLVWSDECRRRGQILGWRDYFVTGAPFLYLNHVVPDPGGPREGTIWYPFHGTVDYESVEGDHSELIREIKETESGPVTMCLYYVEYEQPHIRREYEDAGFRVICHGQRGAKWTGTTTNFLHDQLSELRRHRRVASNRLSTAVLYGLAAGCEAAIYGDPMEFVGGRPGFVGQELLHAWYPDMFGHVLDSRASRSFADHELGADHIMSPDELRIILGWENHG